MSRRAISFSLPLAAMLALAWPAHAGEEEKVTLEQVRPKVRETIDRYVHDGELTSIEKELEKGAIVYEAEYTTKQGKEYELEIAEDGTLLSKEAEDSTKEEVR